MVRTQIAARGISDPRVLEALRQVPRHLFVPASLQDEAYGDHPLPIGLGQTISQPYIVAYMAEELRLLGHERVLEVGSGCGYAAAVLSLLVKEVYGLELEPRLHAHAEGVLQALGYQNIHLRCGDGHAGWPEQAPFDAILVSCATDEVPEALLNQLADGGHLLLPMGTPHGYQQLMRYTRRGKRWETLELIAVAFVPMR